MIQKIGKLRLTGVDARLRGSIFGGMATDTNNTRKDRKIDEDSMTQIQRFAVTTEHRHADWSGRRTFTVRRSPGSPDHAPAFYAEADGFGCGRDRHTQIDAIRSLAGAQGAAVVKILREAKGEL